MFALACLQALIRDFFLPNFLLKLNLLFQVGKKLSDLIRDPGSQTTGGEQGRWQAELAQVAIELIAVSLNFLV